MDQETCKRLRKEGGESEISLSRWRARVVVYRSRRRSEGKGKE